MTAVSLKQTSLSGGILSPQLRGHSDQEKYATGVQDAVNFFVTREGTVENRAGTLFVDSAGVVTTTNQRRPIKFVVSQSLAYLLWFNTVTSNALLSSFFVYQDELPINLATISPAIPAWNNANPYAQGAIVVTGGVYYYALTAVPASILITNTTYWYPMSSTTLEIPIPIPGIALQPVLNVVQYAQLNDLLVLVSQAFTPLVISFAGVTAWTANFFAPSTPVNAPVITAVLPNPATFTEIPPLPPTGLTAVGGSGPLTYSYIVASYITTPSTEFSAGTAPSSPLVGAPSVSNPVVVSWTASTTVAGYAIYRASSDVSGWVLVHTVTTPTVTWSDDGSTTPNPASLAPNSQTGTLLYQYVMTSVDQATGIESLPSAVGSVQSPNPGQAAAPIIVFFTGVEGAASYNIYRSTSAGGGSDPLFGYVGNAGRGSNSFSDFGVIPDSAIQPPTQIVDPGAGAATGAFSLFGSDGNRPAVVGAYQQRLIFANTVNQPQTLWGSRTGAWYAWTQSTPLQADDAAQWTLAAKTIQQIQGLADIGTLVIHTISAEYIAKGDQSGTLTPTTAGIVLQGDAGSQLFQPVVIGNTDLFAQARGSILRDLQFTIQSYNYSGKDCTVFAPNLFAGRTIVAMDWQQVPHSIVWIVLDDGELLSFTYIKEHNIWSWTRHNTAGGFFDNVVVVPEAGEDGVYVSVVRLVNGSSYRYLERLANRAFTDINNAIFVDSAQVYDGRSTSGATMTLTGSGWTPIANLTLTLSDGTDPKHFVPGDVGNAIMLQLVTTAVTYDANNDVIPIGTVTDSVMLKVIAYTSTSVVTVQPGKTVPAWAQATPITTWGKAVHTFTLANLHSSPVTGVGDGNVIPTGATDSSGIFTTANSQNYLRVVLGLPIRARLRTLSIESVQGETLMNKNKRVSEVTLYFYASRGGSFGQTFSALNTWVQRGLIEESGLTWEQWNQGVFLYTGPAIVPVLGTWQPQGQVCIQQTDPLPMGISAMVVTAEVGN